MAMTQADAVQRTQGDALHEAVARFGASLETLERALAQLLEDQATAAKLDEQLRALQAERDRLAQELAAERLRAQRLEAAGDEVSGRLEAAIRTLQAMMPEGPAEA
jgi:chromosome segregation ATPase